jgi:MFS family permease
MLDETSPPAPSQSLPSGQPELEVKLAGFAVGSQRVRRGLLFSFWDGIFNNGMVALNETFAVAAAVYLRAPSMAIALLTALPLLIGSFAQYFAPAHADPKKGRKHYVLLGVRLQAIFVFLAGFMGWLPERFAAWGFVLAFAFAGISNAMTGAFWTAWMGDLIPNAARGRHFAWRSVFFSWMYLSCSLLAGLVSRRYTAQDTPWALFAGVFAVAAMLRFVSYQCLSRQYEPEPPAHAAEKFPPFELPPNRDFVTYCLGAAAFQGAATMSGPFFNVWWLRDLHFDYFSLAITLCTTVAGSIVFAGFWGKLADNFGGLRVLRICALLVAVIPFPYLFFDGKWFIWGFAFYSGATWGGYNLANFNQMLNATDQSHRSRYVAFFSLTGGVIGFCFSMLGGYLAGRLPPLFGSSLRSLFLLSALLRLGIFFAFFGRFREYRQGLPRSRGEVLREFPGLREGLRLMRTFQGQ